MDGEGAVRSQHAGGVGEGLRRDQVDGHGIRRKGIEDHEVHRCVRLAPQQEAAVTDTVERLTGRMPRAFGEFVAAEAGVAR